MKKNLPRVMLFQEDEKALNYKYKLPFQLNSDIAIKSIEYDVDDFLNQGVKLIGPRPTRDDIYYLHPYKNDEYIHESLGESHFLEEKMNFYRQVGSLLGAKTISTKVNLLESKSIEADIDGKVRVKLIDAGTNVKYSEGSVNKDTLEISEKYNLQDNFDLNKNVDMLRDMINKLNLNHELGIISLINARDSRESGTTLSHRTVKSEISYEYNNLLEVSAQLSSPVFSVGANFNRRLEKLNKLNVEISFQF